MTMTVLDPMPVAGDAGGVTGERPERPDPEVPERARRRTFTAQYKLEVLAAYDAAGPGEKGAILRREGLCSTTGAHFAACVQIMTLWSLEVWIFVPIEKVRCGLNVVVTL